MSGDYRVLAKRRIPAKYPIIESVIVFMLIDTYDLSGWSFGLLVAYISILWLIRLSLKVNQKHIDPFNN